MLKKRMALLYGCQRNEFTNVCSDKILTRQIEDSMYHQESIIRK